MNTMTISFVLVRLAATLLLIRGLQGLASFSYLLTGDTQTADFALVTLLFSVFLPVGIAIILWRNPEKVAGAQIRDEKTEQVVSAGRLLMIGITLLGLYVFVYGVVDLFRIEAAQVMQLKMAADMNLPNEAMNSQAVANRVTYAVQIALGLCLILGRNGLSRLFLKAKYGGVVVPAE